jgi:hypothetical protein
MEMPEGATYGDPCTNNDGGGYMQHESALELEMQRLNKIKAAGMAKRLMEAELSPEEAFTSMLGSGLPHELIVRAMLSEGFEAPTNQHVAVAVDAVSVSDTAEIGA